MDGLIFREQTGDCESLRQEERKKGAGRRSRNINEDKEDQKP